MPKVNFVQKARKDVPGSDIKAGESYYWWKFRYGGKRVSRTAPRPSQLTQSEFLGQIYDLEDEIGALTADDGLPDAVADIAQRLRDLGQEQSDKLSNMPDALQQGPTGEMLQERADGCEAAADEFDGLSFDVNDKEDDETEEEYWERMLQDVHSVSIDVP